MVRGDDDARVPGEPGRVQDLDDAAELAVVRLDGGERLGAPHAEVVLRFVDLHEVELEQVRLAGGEDVRGDVGEGVVLQVDRGVA